MRLKRRSGNDLMDLSVFDPARVHPHERGCLETEQPPTRGADGKDTELANLQHRQVYRPTYLVEPARLLSSRSGESFPSLGPRPGFRTGGRNARGLFELIEGFVEVGDKPLHIGQQIPVSAHAPKQPSGVTE